MYSKALLVLGISFGSVLFSNAIHEEVKTIPSIQQKSPCEQQFEAKCLHNKDVIDKDALSEIGSPAMAEAYCLSFQERNYCSVSECTYRILVLNGYYSNSGLTEKGNPCLPDDYEFN